MRCSGLRRSREARDESWPVEIAESSLHTIHNLQLLDIDGDHRDEIVAAAGKACS